MNFDLRKKRTKLPEFGSWGGGFRGFGQCPKENVFFKLRSSLIYKWPKISLILKILATHMDLVSYLINLEVNRPLQNNCHCKTKVADVYNAALAVALFLQSERQLKEARQELTLLVSNIIRIANAVAKHLLF